MLIQMWTKGYV